MILAIEIPVLQQTINIAICEIMRYLNTIMWPKVKMPTWFPHKQNCFARMSSSHGIWPLDALYNKRPESMDLYS